MIRNYTNSTRQLLNIKLDIDRGKSQVSLNEDAPANCYLLDLENWEQIRKENDTFIYYVSSIWYDHYVGVSNLLWTISLKMPGTNFYFKLVEDESVLNKEIPPNLVFDHFPLVIFIGVLNIKIISSGPIREAELERRINEYLKQ